MAIMSFLAGLPSEFEAVEYQILSGFDVTSLHEVFTQVLRTTNASSTPSTNGLVVKDGAQINRITKMAG